MLGPLTVAGESMIGWTGATNVHVIVLPNKPTDKGICLKTLCDARTRVMAALQFVESQDEQAQKRYVDEGKAAAVTLRLTEPWHNKGPRIIIADAWFGGLPTAWSLMKRNLFSICNVKTHTKFVCKKELWASARGERREFQRNDRAFKMTMQVNDKRTTFTGAFYMDRKPTTLLGTAGSSLGAPTVMRCRVYMDSEGELVQWTGELNQPNIHFISRTFFTAVDVHNKLAFGPHSVCSIDANNLLPKVWLASVAISETNSYSTHSRDNNLTSDVSSHGDFKANLWNELVQRAQQVQESVDEEPKILTRGSEESVATRVPGPQRNQMPPALREH
jgi:hypothetical protein